MALRARTHLNYQHQDKLMQPTAVYRHFDANGVLLYVGISNRVGERTWQHSKNAPWFIEVARIELEWFGTRGDAEAAEYDAIRHEHPLHNKAFAKKPPAPIEQFVVLNAAGQRVADVTPQIARQAIKRLASTNPDVDPTRNVFGIIAAKQARKTSSSRNKR